MSSTVVEGKPVEHSNILVANMTFSKERIFQIVNFALLFTHIVAQLFIWFESNWATGVIDTYRNLLVGCVLLFISNTQFLPEYQRSTVNVIGILIWINNIDGSDGGICLADMYINQFVFPPQTLNDYNTLRAGIVISLIVSFSLFFLNVVAPLQLLEAFVSLPRRISLSLASNPIVSVIRVSLLITGMVCFLVSQFLTWGIKLGCRTTISSSLLYETSFLLMSFFVALILLVPNAKHIVDFTLFWIFSNGLTTFKPIFFDVTSSAQANYGDIWRAQISIAFIGFLAVLTSTVLHSLLFFKPAAIAERFTLNGIKQRVFHRIFILLASMVTLGLVGCVLVLVKSPSNAHAANWNVSMLGIVVPIFALVAWVLQIPVLMLVAVTMTFKMYSDEINSGATGILRCGHLIALCASTVAPLAYYSENMILPQQGDEYVKEENRSLTFLFMTLNFVAFLLYKYPIPVWWLVGVIAALFFLGASSKNTTLSRQVFFMLLAILTLPVFIDLFQWAAFLFVGWYTVWTVASAEEFYFAPYYETEGENPILQPLLGKTENMEADREPLKKYVEVS